MIDKHSTPYRKMKVELHFDENKGNYALRKPGTLTRYGALVATGDTIDAIRNRCQFRYGADATLHLGAIVTKTNHSNCKVRYREGVLMVIK